MGLEDPNRAMTRQVLEAAICILTVSPVISHADLFTMVKSSSKVDFPIKAGDTLTVVVGSPEDEVVEGVWVGLLYQVGMKDLTSTKFLIDQFEALIEDKEVE